MEYTGKIPTNIKSRRSKINKGLRSEDKVQRVYGEELARCLNKDEEDL